MARRSVRLLLLLAPGVHPVAAQEHPERAYFGNLHVHTRWSFDAYINGAASDPDAAYRWAKGEEIPGGGDGTPLKIETPLDWYVVSDHAEYLGALPLMEDPSSPVSKHALAADITGGDPAASFAAYGKISDGMYSVPPQRDPILGDRELARSVWSRVVEIADRHYEPGRFTTMAGFEWTSAPDWRNIHRVVVFRNTRNLPEAPFSALDSNRPEDLWAWMEAQRARGAELLAVPHNGNASDGIMFPIGESYGGSELDRAYAETRMRNEPLYELTQIKGTSETHPTLSPNDEFGGFELWDYTLAPTATPPRNKRGGYYREALIRGMALEQLGRGNPFKYGVIGDSDTHNSAASVEEDNYTGKFGFENDPRHRLLGPPGVSPEGAKQVRAFSSGGLAGVWAMANTREEIFAALRRKETFATSGTRMRVRFFGGYDFTEADLEGDVAQAGYARGVPMGGDLTAAGGKRPTFLLAAVKDPSGANLDRIQVVKGWVDAEGRTHEQVHDVAWSDPDLREADDRGRIPPVGTTVDEKTATYTNTIGAAQLKGVFRDPYFDPTLRAVYYMRVLEIPTPRWSTRDAVATGIDRPEDVPVSIQERAWSSPIWFTP